MSIDGIFVVDSVVHGFDTTAANAIGRFGRGVLQANFGFQWAMVPDQRGVVGDRRGPSAGKRPRSAHGLP